MMNPFFLAAVASVALSACSQPSANLAASLVWTTITREGASGASDFSAPSIERRIAAGYADAAAALGERAQAA